MSKVQDAIALMRAENITANKAAERIGVRVSAVYAALKREEVRKLKAGELVRCECCGSMVKPEQIKNADQ